MTDSLRKATNKWQRDNMTVISCKVKNELACEFKTAVERNGTTQNAVLRAAMQEYLKQA